jgi:hypothetical protein
MSWSFSLEIIIENIIFYSYRDISLFTTDLYDLAKNIGCLWIRSVLVFSNDALVILNLFGGIFIYSTF